MKRDNTLNGHHKRLKKTLSFIEAHLDETIVLDELAEVADFSPYHFHRIFTGLVGESVKSYIRRLKLERAARQLLSTKLPIIEIALNAGYDSAEAFTRAFKEKFTLTPSRYRTEQREQRLTTILQFKSEVIKMKAEVKQVPKIRVAYVRHVGPYAEADSAWNKLLACKVLRFDADTKLLGVCYDDPEITEPAKIRYDACVTVANDFQVPVGSGIEIKEIGGGKYVTTTHLGPYATLYQTYRTLVGKWIPQNGFECRAEPPFEIYVNNPQETSPEELITQIYIAVK